MPFDRDQAPASLARQALVNWQEFKIKTFNLALHDPALTQVQAELFTTPITVPTLYFHGARDGCIGVELTNDMDSLFAGGLRKVILADAGHFVHQEKPDEVNRHILDFL